MSMTIIQIQYNGMQPAQIEPQWSYYTPWQTLTQSVAGSPAGLADGIHVDFL